MIKGLCALVKHFGNNVGNIMSVQDCGVSWSNSCVYFGSMAKEAMMRSGKRISLALRN